MGISARAFGALALTARDGSISPCLALFVAVLGVTAAWAAVLTARGSKFWQQNWEAHVDLLEDEVEGKLHKIVTVRDVLTPSVSKVNDRLLHVLAAGWLGIFIAAAAVLVDPALLVLPERMAAFVQVGAAALALIGALGRIMKTPVSDVTDRTFNHDDMSPYVQP